MRLNFLCFFLISQYLFQVYKMHNCVTSVNLYQQVAALLGEKDNKLKKTKTLMCVYD